MNTLPSESLVVRGGQVSKGVVGITGIGRAVHQAQGAGLQVRQGADGRAGSRGEAGGAEDVLGGEGGPDDVVFGDRGSGAEGGEQVSAEQGGGSSLIQQAGVPSRAARAVLRFGGPVCRRGR